MTTRAVRRRIMRVIVWVLGILSGLLLTTTVLLTFVAIWTVGGDASRVGGTAAVTGILGVIAGAVAWFIADEL